MRSACSGDSLRADGFLFAQAALLPLAPDVAFLLADSARRITVQMYQTVSAKGLKRLSSADFLACNFQPRGCNFRTLL